MNTETQLLELLAEGNPATEPSDAPWAGIDAAVYLATLETRRSKMTHLETRRTDPEADAQKREDRQGVGSRRGLLVAGAAFAFVLAVVGIVATITDTPPTTTIPPATTATTTTTSAPPTTVDPANLTWDELPDCCEGRDVWVRVESFEVPFAINRGEPARFVYWGNDADTDHFGLIYPIGNALTQVDVAIHDGSVDSAAQAWRAIHDRYESAEMTEPVPTTLGGAAGVMFSTIGLPLLGDNIGDHDFIVGDEGWVIASGRGEVWVVDVNGTTVVIGYGGTEDCGPACGDAPPPQTAIDRAEAAARDLIASIRWRDLGL